MASSDDLPGESLAAPPGAEGRGALPGALWASLAEVGVAVIATDASGRVVRINAEAERLTGWSVDEKRGAPLGEVFRTAAPPGAEDEASFALELGVAAPEAEHTALLERRDGQAVTVRHAIAPVEIDGEEGRLIVFRDVSTEQLLTQRLARRVRYDVLTGLLNRQEMDERIEHALAESRASGARHALSYFDLDRFRLVNATCGHDAGDDLLHWVGTRVHEALRPEDAAARIGGDEFALLLHACDPREAERIVRDLQRTLLEFRFGWEDKTFAVGASFGLVFFGAELARASDVLRAADHACRLAKESGRGRLQVYLDDDDKMAQSIRSIQWVAGIQRHLADGRLRLYAQGIHPLAPMPDAGVHFEVLVRRVDDEGQLHSPVAVIHAAEQSGQMHSIDRFVVRQAFRMIGALPQRALRRLDTCAINLSGVSLTRKALLDFLVDELERAGVPPRKICFEITETAALADLGEVRWFMQELGAMGCRFAIDDFGSGHASYGYIESLPVDYVKIDGLFVRDLPDNALHRAIVESVHRIGATLGIKTVGESVETEEIAALLASMGIHYAQGWLFGQPRPLAEELAALDVPDAEG
jgi:diguanylate cyclase (GGDEF)-like protein/PAS domain S-box-containing protein